MEWRPDICDGFDTNNGCIIEYHGEDSVTNDEEHLFRFKRKCSVHNKPDKEAHRQIMDECYRRNLPLGDIQKEIPDFSAEEYLPRFDKDRNVIIQTKRTLPKGLIDRLKAKYKRISI